MTRSSKQKKTLLGIPRLQGIILIALLAIATVLASLRFIPVEAFHTGSCSGGQIVRLRILAGDRENFEQIRQETIERIEKEEQFLHDNPRFAAGCSMRKTYRLYVL